MSTAQIVRADEENYKKNLKKNHFIWRKWKEDNIKADLTQGVTWIEFVQYWIQWRALLNADGAFDFR
jgi:hypothetical protein